MSTIIVINNFLAFSSGHYKISVLVVINIDHQLFVYLMIIGMVQQCKVETYFIVLSV